MFLFIVYVLFLNMFTKHNSPYFGWLTRESMFEWQSIIHFARIVFYNLKLLDPHDFLTLRYVFSV